MQRFNDWPDRLAAHIASAREAEFRWGSFDCALFAAGAIHAMTGVDLAADFRGKYSDEAGARALFSTALDHASGMLPPVDLGFARRGDLVLVKNGSVLGGTNEPGLAIVGLDGRRALAAAERGLVYMARANWLRAWRV
jgi:hypothetical protein